MALLAGTWVLAQEPVSFDLGPTPNRNLFSFFQAPLVYEPQSPFLVGAGHWRISLHEVEANVFTLPRPFFALQGPGWGIANRTVMTQDYFHKMINEANDSHQAFMAYADEEITRSQFQVRTGVGPTTDAWVEINAESHSGGFLDTLAESWHEFSGFSQFGRPDLAKNQCVVAIGGNGQVLFYSGGDRPLRFLDPMIGVVHQVQRGPRTGLDLMFTAKPAMTKAYDEWKSGLDLEGGLGGWWQNGRTTLLYGGAYTHRGDGNAPYQFLHYTSDLALHLGWQGRNQKQVQPYFLLCYSTGIARPGCVSGFNKAWLQHDLGVHWFVTPRTAVTLRYTNNITENQNTDDFQVSMGLTSMF